MQFCVIFVAFFCNIFTKVNLIAKVFGKYADNLTWNIPPSKRDEFDEAFRGARHELINEALARMSGQTPVISSSLSISYVIQHDSQTYCLCCAILRIFCLFKRQHTNLRRQNLQNRRLYDWSTAKKVCPKGWHLPNRTEWDKLFRFVDDIPDSKHHYMSFTAGKHLKAASGWNNGGNGTNAHGFSALTGGSGNSGNSFGFVGSGGYWWSSSECGYNSNYAYHLFMYYDEDYAFYTFLGKSILRSVRCVQD